jgi:hypothetical protein
MKHQTPINDQQLRPMSHPVNREQDNFDFEQWATAVRRQMLVVLQKSASSGRSKINGEAP